jgi:adenine-specific DNA-methyltransferase
MQNLLTELTELLSTDDRLVSEGRLIKNKIVELALAVDPLLLRHLLSSHNMCRHFFSEVDEIKVFDKIKFQRFVNNKSFLADSYTAFKNKVGLMDGDEYVADKKEVVLVWPYKDCVLEGGQDKEDAVRTEVFWNEVLAPDQIDRLLSPKVLTNFKRFSASGEGAVDVLDGSESLVIKGNNLLALHTLEKVYEGRVKLIYLDPPYNTGGDSFGYNDRFNHSTWLTFMKNRLEVAHRLLRKDGVIFVSLDDNEAHYCKVLMDSIFGRENFVADICHKARASVSNDKIISSSHNHILFFAKNERLVYEQRAKFGIKNDLSGFDLNDGIDDYKLVPVDGPGGASKGNPFYEFMGIEGYWRFSKATMQEMYDKGLIVKTGSNLQQKYYKSKAAQSKKTVTTWWDEGFLTSSATGELKRLMGEEVFKNPKSVPLLKRIVELSTGEGDIVLDFFGGSGTTAQAVLEMSREDGLKRQFILCEQMNYEAGLPSSRIKKVLESESFVECQLAKANQVFADKIGNCKKSEELVSVWEDMKEKAFLSYKIDVAAFDKSKSDFQSLGVDDQKRFLLEVLDKNMLCVPLSEIGDKAFGISAEDQLLNKKFFKVSMK